MAARKRKLTLDEDWKQRIRASQIANRFEKCFNGELELTAMQLKAGQILFNKLEPDLARSDNTISNPDGSPINTNFTINVKK